MKLKSFEQMRSEINAIVCVIQARLECGEYVSAESLETIAMQAGQVSRLAKKMAEEKRTYGNSRRG